MLPSFLLALREGVEAALVVGILFGALRRLQRPDLSFSVWMGVISAIVVSLLAAIGLHIAGAELEGPAEPIFEGTTLILAAGLLTWMIFWMHHQSRFLKGRIENKFRQALSRSEGEPGGRNTLKRALFGVAFLAVVREGVELALFLVAAGLGANTTSFLSGALLGLAGAFALGWVMFTSTRRLPLGSFFRVTNILLILFAAGLVARGVHEFNEVGWIPSVIERVYNLSAFLPQSSTLGQVFQTLLGYSDAPSLTQLLAYLIYFAVLTVSLVRIQRRLATQQAAPGA